jgi:hypothetical protein
MGLLGAQQAAPEANRPSIIVLPLDRGLVDQECTHITHGSAYDAHNDRKVMKTA